MPQPGDRIAQGVDGVRRPDEIEARGRERRGQQIASYDRNGRVDRLACRSYVRGGKIYADDVGLRARGIAPALQHFPSAAPRIERAHAVAQTQTEDRFIELGRREGVEEPELARVIALDGVAEEGGRFGHQGGEVRAHRRAITMRK